MKKTLRYNRLPLIFLCIFFLAIATAGFPWGIFGKSGQENAKVQEFTLDNGLTVLIREQHSKKIATLDMWVRTGSANETNEINGISHFLEHMLFKGTDTRGVGEIDQVIESVGGNWNAGTSRDYTHFYVTVGSKYFDVALDVLSDVVQHAALDRGEFDKERSVVLEEIRRKQDNPRALLWERQFKHSFESGPYKLSVLGTPSSIGGITVKMMTEYYRDFYTPDNMALIICGDVNAREILPKIESVFSDFDRKLNTSKVRQTETVWATGVNNEISKQVGEVYLLIAFPALDMSDYERVCAMDIMLTILSDGRSSRLYRHVKDEKQLVSTIGAHYPSMKHEAVFAVSATCKPENLSAAKKEIFAQIERFVKKGPTIKEMKKAKRIINNSHYFSTETTAGQASHLGFYYTLTHTTDFADNYTAYIRKVSRKTIKQVARQYLNADLANIFVIKPDSQ